MKTFRYIVSNVLILNLSVLLWASSMCPCSQATHEETQCSHSKNSHSDMTHSGSNSAVMAHNMDTHQEMNVVHNAPALLRNESCCCQTFEVKKESPVDITALLQTKTKSAKSNLKPGDHFVYDHGLFVPDNFALSKIENNDSNPIVHPIYLLNSAFLI